MEHNVSGSSDISHEHRAVTSVNQAEPVPWGTGIAVAVLVAALVGVTLVILSIGLGATNAWLALLANVLIAAGVAPSVWLGLTKLVWRWVAYGAIAGFGCAWFALLLSLL